MEMGRDGSAPVGAGPLGGSVRARLRRREKDDPVGDEPGAACEADEPDAGEVWVCAESDEADEVDGVDRLVPPGDAGNGLDDGLVELESCNRAGEAIPRFSAIDGLAGALVEGDPGVGRARFHMGTNF